MAELKRVLGFKTLVMISIISMMGSAVFFDPPLGARIAGPASIISWVLLTLLAVYIAKCFGELAAMFPKAGGIYEYSKQAYGRLLSFVIAWISLLVSIISIAMLTIGAVQYLAPLQSSLFKVIVSSVIVIMFSIVAYRGIETSSMATVFFGIIAMVLLLSIVIPGFFKMDIGNLRPIFALGMGSSFIAIFYIAESVFGWEATTQLAEETINPEKVMPKALTISTLIVGGFCTLVALVSIAILGAQKLSLLATPTVDLAVILYSEKVRNFFVLSIYISTIGAILAYIISTPRFILALTRDKLFPGHFSDIHPKYATPHKAIMLQMLVIIALVIFAAGSYKSLLEVMMPLALIMYCFVMLALIILRFKVPDEKRPYKAPFGIVGPIVIIIIFAALLWQWVASTPEAVRTFRFALSLLGLGIPIYFLIKSIIIFCKS